MQMTVPPVVARISFQDLLDATSEPSKRYFVTTRAHMTAGQRGSAFHGLRSLQLHPCFANSLRLAQVRTWPLPLGVKPAMFLMP